MTSSHAALCSRSIADWASNGSASMPSHSGASRFEVSSVGAALCLSTTSS